MKSPKGQPLFNSEVKGVKAKNGYKSRGAWSKVSIREMADEVGLKDRLFGGWVDGRNRYVVTG